MWANLASSEQRSFACLGNLNSVSCRNQLHAILWARVVLLRSCDLSLWAPPSVSSKSEREQYIAGRVPAAGVSPAGVSPSACSSRPAMAGEASTSSFGQRHPVLGNFASSSVSVGTGVALVSGAVQQLLSAAELPVAGVCCQFLGCCKAQF